MKHEICESNDTSVNKSQVNHTKKSKFLKIQVIVNIRYKNHQIRKGGAISSKERTMVMHVWAKKITFQVDEKN